MIGAWVAFSPFHPPAAQLLAWHDRAAGNASERIGRHVARCRRCQGRVAEMEAVWRELNERWSCQLQAAAARPDERSLLFAIRRQESERLADSKERWQLLAPYFAPEAARSLTAAGGITVETQLRIWLGRRYSQALLKEWAGQ